MIKYPYLPQEYERVRLLDAFKLIIDFLNKPDVGYVVAGLPTGSLGMRTCVTDATVTTFASIVAGGGANKVPVFHNGTNWIIG